ncbi:hypothetical protein H696_02575 [Fonticula alba]|uniref:Cdc23 domain-containing protein n=1 Tax=Fonticula alba TaxID=691883 RepID=A0A058Z7I7_FONAL|nr:hypothetical protein H696_02575 [Fonticula alba]KCV70245.1 hypothetical protein H696_02575 [Fonticula alba]|eukprot:XP_009494761.1 hypothetical protein H696_02575 [Fonticula alba]
MAATGTPPRDGPEDSLTNPQTGAGSEPMTDTDTKAIRQTPSIHAGRLLRALKRCEQARRRYNIPELSLAHAALPPSVHRARVPYLLDLLCFAALARADYSTAAQHFGRLRALYPWRLTGMDQYASALLVLRRPRSLSHLSRMLARIEPQAAETWAAAGAALAAMGGRRQASRRALVRAVRLSPESPYAWTMLGHELRDQGRLDEACTAYERAVSLDPLHFVAWYSMAMVHARRRQRSSALVFLRRALLIYDTPLLYFHYSAILHDSGRLDDAAHVIEHAIHLSEEQLQTEDAELDQPVPGIPPASRVDYIPLKPHRPAPRRVFKSLHSRIALDRALVQARMARAHLDEVDAVYACFGLPAYPRDGSDSAVHLQAALPEQAVAALQHHFDQANQCQHNALIFAQDAGATAEECFWAEPSDVDAARVAARSYRLIGDEDKAHLFSTHAYAISAAAPRAGSLTLQTRTASSSHGPGQAVFPFDSDLDEDGDLDTFDGRGASAGQAAPSADVEPDPPGHLNFQDEDLLDSQTPAHFLFEFDFPGQAPEQQPQHPDDQHHPHPHPHQHHQHQHHPHQHQYPQHHPPGHHPHHQSASQGDDNATQSSMLHGGGFDPERDLDDFDRESMELSPRHRM